MTKNKSLSLAALGIALVVLNVLIFTLPSLARGESFWVSYIFIMLGLLVQFGVVFFAWNRVINYKSKFLNIPIVYVGYFYMVLQFVFNMIVMFTATPKWVSIMMNTILLGGYAVLAIGIEAGKDEIERVEKKVQAKVFYIRSLQVDIETMMLKATDPTAKKSLAALVETVKYSDPMSNELLAELELEISDKTKVLKQLISNGQEELVAEQSKAIELLIGERNKKCKILK